MNPKCHKCGKEVEGVWFVIPNKKLYTCIECKEGARK